MNCLHWSPVRDIGCPRDLWRQDTKLRVLIGGVLLGRGTAVRALLATCTPSPSGDVCAEPLRLEGSPETRGVPSSGAGPSQNGTCSGGGIGRKIRAGRSAVNYFRFGRTRVCITPVSLHRVEEWVLSGQNRSKQSYHGALC